MGARGPRPRPAHLKLLEGDPGHEGKGNLAGKLRLPPAVLQAPSWADVFPLPAKHVCGDGCVIDEDTAVCLVAVRVAALRGEVERLRRVAKREWDRIVPQLTAHGILSAVDWGTVVDLCRVEAEIDRCTRDMARRGHWVMSERGAVRNPSAVMVGNLRSTRIRYVGELGLTPSARSSMDAPKPPAANGDSPFDV